MTLKALTSYALPVLERKHSLLQAIFFMFLALLIMGIHVILGTALGLAGFVWIIGITMACLLVKPELAFTLMLVNLFLQNTFVAAVAPSITDFQDYGFLMASSFLSILLTSVICIPVWLGLRDRFPNENRVLLRWMFLFFAVIAVYSILGIISVPPAYVLLYARIYLVGGLLLGIGLAFGFQMKLDYAISVIRLLAAILVVWGFVEFLWTHDLYNFFNVVDYFRFKSMYGADALAVDTVDDIVNYSSRSYLNLTGMLGLNLQILRPNGPNLHPITYAYCAVFCGLSCFISRSYILMAACLILVVLIGAKGPLVITFLSLMLYYFYNVTRNPRWLMAALICVMVCYAAAGLVYGTITSDYHVIGFFGGIRGFLSNPLGHGVGVGGSLSSLSMEEKTADYQYLQNFGADYGFESALGVLIYQIGVSIVVFMFLYWKLWKSAWNAALYFAEERRLIIVPIVFALLFINGIFQEEAFSPAGWGLWLLFSGLLIARHWRQQMNYRPL